jgi:choline dehydrogenase-like flavoprotein
MLKLKLGSRNTLGDIMHAVLFNLTVGTSKMGLKSDSMAVVDRNFKVYGAKSLRVVDASVFPKIPGFFIQTPTYMISGKAADAILADAKSPDTTCVSK